MPARRTALTLLAGLAALAAAHAQTFDIEQFPQLFRPQMKVDLRLQPATAFSDTSGDFQSGEASGVFTIPIASRFDAGLRLDTSARSLGDLLKSSLRVKASQVVGTVRFSAREQQLGFDRDPTRQAFTAGVGVTGMSLTRRYRVLFWSATAYAAEETATMDELVPRFNAVIGQMHVKGLRRQFFYGLALAYSDHLVLPLPFIGGNAPLGRRWSFQYTLPAQVAVGFKPRAHTKFMLGCAVDGSRHGAEWHNERVNIDQAMVRAFLNVRHTAGRHLQIRAEIGHTLTRGLAFSQTPVEPSRYPVGNGFVFGVGANVLFGGSVAERLIDLLR